MSPYDDGWMLEAELLHAVSVEIALNDPRTESVASSGMRCFALVCTECHLILKRDFDATEKPAPEPAPQHWDYRHPSRLICGVMLPPECPSATAVWQAIAED